MRTNFNALDRTVLWRPSIMFKGDMYLTYLPIHKVGILMGSLGPVHILTIILSKVKSGREL